MLFHKRFTSGHFEYLDPSEQLFDVYLQVINCLAERGDEARVSQEQCYQELGIN